MTEEFTIQLVRKDRTKIPACIRLNSDPVCQVYLQFENTVLEGTATDFFEAFAAVRKQLEMHELLPDCYAASRNVWPSGMARSMSNGLVAYRLTLGQQGPPRVHIFKTGDDVEPVTVDEQEVFFKKWWSSVTSAV